MRGCCGTADTAVFTWGDPDAPVDGAPVITLTLTRLARHGAQLVSTDVVQYEDVYRLCYLRGPEDIMVGLAQSIR